MIIKWIETLKKNQEDIVWNFNILTFEFTVYIDGKTDVLKWQDNKEIIISNIEEQILHTTDKMWNNKEMIHNFAVEKNLKQQDKCKRQLIKNQDALVLLNICLNKIKN
jgi:hypothetical protein